MTLLITVLTAIASTIIWYSSEKARKLKVGVLLYMFWGASLMWFADAVTGYFEAGAKYFEPSAHDMLNDTFLGFSVTALALAVWIIYLFIKDPSHIVQKKYKNN